jgi:hypothetical protein
MNIRFKTGLALLAFALPLAAGALAQTQYLPIPSGVGTSGQVLAVTSDGNNVQGTSAPSFATSITVGAAGTAITQIRVFSQGVTPGQVGANTCAEQTFTVTGVATTDKLVLNGVPGWSPAATSIRPSGANTVAVMFCNPGNGAASPAAGTVSIVAIRSS